MELIDKAEVIALVTAKQKALCPPDRYSRHAVYGEDRVVFDALDEILDAVEALPSLDTGWVSVKDRLPEDGYDKLCYVIIPESGGKYFRTQRILHYSKADKGWNCSGMIVTHWMPLPEPPKEAADG